MAQVDSNPQPDIPMDGEELKYLEFVQVAVLQAIFCFAKAYDYAKNNAGPLKPGVHSIEDTVKTIVGPVYEKYHDVPKGLLKFADRKVDESVNKLDSRVPPLVKQVSTQAFSAAQKAPAVARAVASEVKSVGVVQTASDIAKTAYTKCEPAAKELYSKYEPVAEQYAASAWHSLNRHKLFAQVAQVVIPKAAFCSEKYNEVVQKTAEKGYKISTFLPLVPNEKIAKVFGSNEPLSQPLISN